MNVYIYSNCLTQKKSHLHFLHFVLASWTVWIAHYASYCDLWIKPLILAPFNQYVSNEGSHNLQHHQKEQEKIRLPSIIISPEIMKDTKIAGQFLFLTFVMWNVRSHQHVGRRSTTIVGQDAGCNNNKMR